MIKHSCPRVYNIIFHSVEDCVRNALKFHHWFSASDCSNVVASFSVRFDWSRILESEDSHRVECLQYDPD